MSGTVAGLARHTRQRGEILALLAGTGEFRSPQQLHAVLRGRGSAVGLATVYRTLKLLAMAGEIDHVLLPDGERRYRRCGHIRHHHHLVCRSCGTTVVAQDPVIERWTLKLAADHGFTEVSHTLEIFGLCAECSRLRAAIPPCGHVFMVTPAAPASRPGSQ